MNWIAYALIAAVATAIVGVIDKAVLSNWMKKPIGSFFVFGVIELVSGVIALVALGFPRIPFLPFVISLATGAAFAASSLCYFKAVKMEEVSRVMPLYGLSPVLVAIMAAVFLGEVFAPTTYLGIFLISFGVVLLSLKRLRGLRFGRGMAWMLLAVAFIAAGAVASKFALDTLDPWTVFAYGKLGTVFATLPFAREGYRVFAQAVRAHGPSVIVSTLVSEGITSMTTIFFLLAASTGYVTLANALVGTHPLFLLLFTALISVYKPSILKEELGGAVLARKLIAIACMGLGMFFVA